ncbi:hypothetical protein ZIOFF_059017 [Zingiber officinale]|uniref:UBR-type domain-containing protein n=1 Tax=Zingiber officinale TaxID=94328 RepID=A0A8J5KF63_ZINOF|nr:hypothetical protein ZIOFF_059017 [Zingiber officinale]
MADASEDETEQTVTIGEYIEELEAEELEADLVLGGDEGKECTYPGGYMKRQAIFSCLTCVPSGNAGVCTACSLSCHDGHEVVELWTKRKFRCDCGNSKFGEFSCKLHPDKEPENTGNSYNQNFRGCYCTCGRPYPDPDAKEQIEMIQCCICEDWFHENHLGLNSLDKIPRDEDGEPVYDDFVCEKCASIFSFLKLYPSSIWALPKQKNVPSVQSGTENMSVIHESSSGNDSTCENGTEDTIEEYEKMAKSKREEKLKQQEGAELNFLNTLNHVQKIEIFSGIADMKNELHSFLESFDSSKPVTSDDIKGVFENLAKKKKQRHKLLVGLVFVVLLKSLLLETGWEEMIFNTENVLSFNVEFQIRYIIEEEDTYQFYLTYAKKQVVMKQEEDFISAWNMIESMNSIMKNEIYTPEVDKKSKKWIFWKRDDTYMFVKDAMLSLCKMVDDKLQGNESNVQQSHVQFPFVQLAGPPPAASSP